MERLTYKNKYGWWEANGNNTNFAIGYDGEPALVRGNVVDKLAEYEDLEEQKMLLKLPSKTVYFIVDKGTARAMVLPKHITDLTIYEVMELVNGKSKRYFLSEEEAQSKLSKLSNKSNEHKDGVCACCGADTGGFYRVCDKCASEFKY